MPLCCLQLRVFYAREQPWTPIVLIVVITAVKIAASLAAPHLTDDRELVAGYLGMANGLGFLAGADGRLRPAARESQAARWQADQPAGSAHHPGDDRRLVARRAYRPRRRQLLGLESLTRNWGGAGSLLRLLVLGLLMVPIIAGVMLAARVPDAQAALAAVRRRLGRRAHERPRPRGTGQGR